MHNAIVDYTHSHYEIRGKTGGLGAKRGNTLVTPYLVTRCETCKKHGGYSQHLQMLTTETMMHTTFRFFATIDNDMETVSTTLLARFNAEYVTWIKTQSSDGYAGEIEFNTPFHIDDFIMCFTVPETTAIFPSDLFEYLPDIEYLDDEDLSILRDMTVEEIMNIV